MKFGVIQRILGILLMIFSTAMLPPLLVSLWYGDGMLTHFGSAFCALALTGLLVWLPVHRHKADLRIKDGFVVVVLFWTVLSLAGSIPFHLAGGPGLGYVDSLFESVSGLTTTGATVIVGIDGLPESILFYRQLLQWLGGMGIVVLAVAVLPMLGIGGMQLYKAETPGPVKDSKLTPRITETAKALWYIYLSLTLACTLAYWLAGMDLFDAVNHAFSTVAIGGFSTHDASMGHFDSGPIDLVAIVFMFLAGINFSLHFMTWRHRNPGAYLRDAEFRFYAMMLLLVTLLVTLVLIWHGTYQDPADALLNAAFQAVSIGTTTGFTTTEFYLWPPFLQILLLFSSFVGGCAGSTGGGIKVIRFLLLIRQGTREITRLVHPNAQLPIRIGGRTIPRNVIDAVWGFFALYVAAFTLMYLALALTGLDLMTAFSAVAACMNNLGPGLSSVGAHYATLDDIPKLILCFAMLLGRLEVFTLLVLLTPAFWRD